MIDALLAYIDDRHPIHFRKISKNLASTPGMREDLAAFLDVYARYMRDRSIDERQLADAYLTMVNQMTEARLDFVRTGKYPAETQAAAVEAVYGNTAVMTQYMLGLALSQFLWKHHYEVFSFYRRQIRAIAAIGTALEVGSGHGLFLLDLIAAHPEVERVDVVDISATSLSLTEGLLRTIAAPAAAKVGWVNADIAAFAPATAYDFITMGEVLEHVPEPARVLAALKALLTPGGRIFMSTCANCPTVDHIYHFETVDEIRSMIAGAGLSIAHESVVPSEDLSDEDLARYRLDILYAAILTA